MLPGFNIETTVEMTFSTKFVLDTKVQNSLS